MSKKTDVCVAGIFWFFLAILIGIFFYININHYTVNMDSDVASDALLATVLYENGFVQPESWCGSAEICVISAPNLAAFIYPLVGKNMNLSMGIACNVLAILLVVVMYVYFRKAGFSYAESVLPVLLLFALCTTMIETEKMVILFAAYYVSHFISLFIILLAYNCFLKGKASVPIWIFTVVLAFINGLQGMHAFLFCYAPLIGIEFFRQFFSMIKYKKIDRFLVTFWSLLLGIITYFTSKISNSFGVSIDTDYGDAPLKFVREIWPVLRELSGFDRAPIVTTLLIVVTIAGYVIIIGRILKKHNIETDSYESSQLWSALIPVISLCICIFANAVTDTFASARYFMMMFFMIGMGCLYVLNRKNTLIKICVILITVVVSFLSIRNLYVESIRNDRHLESREYLAGKWMTENGYEYGYSTFDHANFITAMSNNHAKVRAVSSMDQMKGLAWLTDRTWYPPIKSADGPTCYIVSPSMMEDFEKFLNRYDPDIIEIGEAGNYLIYVLDHDYTLWER